MKVYQIGSLAAMALALSACTTLDTAHPDKMYRQAIMHNMQKDNQYNFNGEATLSWQHNEAASAASAPVAASDNTQAEALFGEMAADGVKIVLDEHDVTDNDGINSDEWLSELSQLMVESAEKYPVISSLMQHSAVKVDGAMDLPNGVVEIIPALKLGTANYGAWAQLPIYIDGKNERVLMDVQGYAGLLQTSILGDSGSATSSQLVRRLEEGALLELHAGKEHQRYPLKTVVRALPKGLEQSLQAMDAKLFTLEPMDAYGRSLNAAHRVQVDYGVQDSMKWSAAFLKGYQEEFLHLQKTAPEAGVSEEAYEEVQGLLLLGAMVWGATDTTSETCQESEEMQQACEQAQQQLQQQLAGLPRLQHNLYLNRSGRILGMQDVMVLKSDTAKKNLVYTSQIKLSNFGRPQMQMLIKNRPTVSVWDFMEAEAEAKELE
ncbi:MULTISPECIES: hypothetical protein [Vitreoscilla]|uniref:Lipoprotein n=1 Tax=Vitreoscilla stercoraria TaxID=61 RepID=A0ABY4EFM0_VITST|nr:MULTISPECIES: hypothetical protein [Vitreoscilla]AUZ05138.2 hypothetical protein ADP71_15710 [Vitreoscilla sp. C1]UOO93513.1 hypothetical protein LVJ81_05670 [Vitreoscilla stercoraria]